MGKYDTNAWEELLDFMKYHGKSLLATHIHGHGVINLFPDHTPEEYDEFMCSMNFHYDSGYANQELFGTVFFTDQTWAERWEYDGAEGWRLCKVPELPKR